MYLAPGVDAHADATELVANLAGAEAAVVPPDGDDLTLDGRLDADTHTHTSWELRSGAGGLGWGGFFTALEARDRQS